MYMYNSHACVHTHVTEHIILNMTYMYMHMLIPTMYMYLHACMCVCIMYMYITAVHILWVYKWYDVHLSSSVDVSDRITNGHCTHHLIV